MPETEVSAVAWAALERAASKECRRELLAEGSRREVELRIDGTIDEEPFVRSVRGPLCVGHAGVRAASSGPDANHLLAIVLGKLSAKTREKLLEELPDRFAELGRLPDVPDARIDEAKRLFQRLRTKVQQAVRPAVSFPYIVGRP